MAVSSRFLFLYPEGTTSEILACGLIIPDLTVYRVLFARCIKPHLTPYSMHLTYIS